jgi:predicted XRE-type DNA-binding protein
MTKTIHSFKSVWDALADTPEQAANLRARINDLLRGRISRFSLDALVNIAAALGRPVRVELEHPKPKRLSRERRSA